MQRIPIILDFILSFLDIVVLCGLSIDMIDRIFVMIILCYTVYLPAYNST